MSRLRCAARALALSVVTAVLFAVWVATRPLLLVSRGLGWRSHAALFQLWARLCARVIGLRIAVEGRPPEPPFLLVSNHLGYVDVITLGALVRARFLSRADVAHWPVIGLLARAMGTLFIDRARKSELPRVAGEMAAVLDRGEGLVMFPEGTSSGGETVLPFRPPLFEVAVRAGLPVSCAAISYATPAGCPPASQAVAWWGDMTFGSHVLGLLSLPRIEGRVRFGAATLTGADRKLLARDAWRAVAGELARSARPTVAAAPS